GLQEDGCGPGVGLPAVRRCQRSHVAAIVTLCGPTALAWSVPWWRSWWMRLTTGSIEKGGTMPEITPAQRKHPAAEKFRAHGVQSEWLNNAKDREIHVKLADGEVLD